MASNVTTIAAGEMHSLFLKNDGSLWGMGWDYSGLLGDGYWGGHIDNSSGCTNRPEQNVASNIMAITGGYQHSFFSKVMAVYGVR